MEERASLRRTGIEKYFLDPEGLAPREQVCGQDGPPTTIAGSVDDALDQSVDFLHASEDRHEV
jgi:hypothetical protein